MKVYANTPGCFGAKLLLRGKIGSTAERDGGGITAIWKLTWAGAKEADSWRSDRQSGFPT
jgi:hypothetical protein